MQSGPTAPSGKSGKSGSPTNSPTSVRNRVRRKLNGEPWVEDGNGQLGYNRYNVAGYSNDFGALDILSHSSKSGKSGPTSPSEGKSGKSGGPSSGKSSKCKKFCTNRPTGSPTQVVSCSLLLSFRGGIRILKKVHILCNFFEKMDPIILYSLQIDSL